MDTPQIEQKQTITAEALTEFTGRLDAFHKEVAELGFIPHPTAGKYLLAQTIRGLLRYYKVQDDKRDEEIAHARRPMVSLRRANKIGRMPLTIRNIVNSALENGKTYRQVIALLEAEGIQGVSKQDVGKWFRGGSRKAKGSGFRDYLVEQDRLNDMRINREYAFTLAKENDGSKIREAAVHIAASQIYDVISTIDPEGIKESVRKNPDQYAKLLGSLARLSDQGLKYDKYRDEVKARAERIRTEISVAKGEGGLTKETVERIERELNLM